ncbi:Nif3-like dinuclear metal center hexameric protein [Desulfococcaceae bacterium HSG8]|nr:Nif3-like dinuclear metal center hexameric protein [Desulfococcaceae bacterium HSG8]
MAATIADIIGIMEKIAPSRLAEEWDNTGLQVGKRDWPVKTIRVALDPLPSVIVAACEQNTDLLITHHPLIFKPLKTIDPDTPVGAAIHMAFKHRLAVFSAHTNLDSAVGGVNDLLASEIGLRDLSPLVKSREPEIYKLIVYVPVEHEQKVLTVLFDMNVGRIGEYSCCSFRSRGKGTFMPGASSKPFIGNKGKISHADESRIETVISKSDIPDIIGHIREHHPYETMAYDICPLLPPESSAGLGRVGTLEKETGLRDLALKIREKLGQVPVKFAGKEDLPVRRVALCAGSGSSLMNSFFSSRAQVYISGDLRYHDARDAEAAGRGVIDIGHFASEHLIVNSLSERLTKMLSEISAEVKVEAYLFEKDPFVML